MKPIKVVTIGAAAALLIGIPQFIRSQTATDSTEILNRPSDVVRLSNTTTPDILAEALTNAGVPGGIAVKSNCGGLERRFLSPSEKTLRGVLDAVSSADPEYSWKLDRGVVNFVPRENEPRLLKTIVSRLEVRNVEPNEALSQLLALPEVAKAARGELGFQTVTGGPYAFMMDGSKPERQKVSLSLTNVTVQEALNEIARAHGTAVWILVMKDDCGPNNAHQFFDLHFISR